MPQIHYSQHGTFHIVTNAKDGIPWCTYDGIPEILIDNLVMTRNIQKARIFAFCILPDHMHVLICPSELGLSKFMQSFKCNSSRDVRRHILTRSSDAGVAASTDDIFWQKGYYDEHIKSSAQRSRVTRYIRNNPVKLHGFESRGF